MGNNGSGYAKRRSLDAIQDNFRSVEEVTTVTKSNEWTGKRSFQGKCLHAVNVAGVYSNPYEDVIQSIGETLQQLDDDDVIPVYGFGDRATGDSAVFSFSRDASQEGFALKAIRNRYRELVPQIHLAGPTSFAPVIHEAINIVSKTRQFHILLIIADGQVTRPSDTPRNDFSKNERETIEAIKLASHFPLSIVTVGVGDGPWGTMETFDDHIRGRKFDNFQFVDFTSSIKR
ncbi:hypothetical protein P43SY_003893 [Pythium insidiosum]|uniref:VWFA domain-containing protein n=1 Tax=Pythium insidiosum TaxID=114742 RepID=A0AAD5Q884_PYTIN|nr:hypothetical protein P43SY_003893 [Pythium insidiosum]